MSERQSIFKSKLFKAGIINLLFLMIFVFMFNPAEKTDDMTIKYILSGSMSGYPDAHAFYINYFLGYILFLFQKIIPGVAWFIISQYIVIFASLTAFTYLILKENRTKYPSLIYLPVIIYFGFEGYIKITFTKTAGYAVGVGLLYIVFALDKPKLSIKRLVIGSIFVVSGIMFRSKILTAVLPIFAGVILVRYIHGFIAGNKKILKKESIKKFSYSMLFFVIIYIVTLVLSSVGNYFFKRNKEWEQYKDYNELKVEIQDYGWPDYDENAEAYAELGISRNDYKLWYKKDYGDPDILTLDLLQKIVDMKEEVTLETYFTSITPFFRTYPFAFLDIKAFGAVLILVILLILSEFRHKAITFAYLCIILMMEYYYLFVNGRYDKPHVDIAIAFSVSMFLCYYITRSRFNVKNAKTCGLFALIVLLYSINAHKDYIKTDTYEGVEFRIEIDEARAILDALADDKESLYIFSNTENYGLLRAFGAFESPEAGYTDNIFILSGYMYPSHNAVLKERGITNIYHAICDDNVYYVTTKAPGNADLILKYLREHYYPNATYEEYRSIGNTVIYKYHKEKLKK